MRLGPWECRKALLALERIRFAGHGLVPAITPLLALEEMRTNGPAAGRNHPANEGCM
jgi:hypothetical protein